MSAEHSVASGNRDRASPFTHCCIVSSAVRRLFSLSLLHATTLLSRAADPASPVATDALHNVFRIGTDLFSGDAPENDAAFHELARLGVKTIISVDGSKPRVDLARRFGMRYVHLPIGYDGIPQPRGEELAKAAQAADGPVYVHCHHGKHRGPAAAATVCRALKGWDTGTAEAFLKQAGTSPDYAGLHRDVRAFHPPDAEALAKLPAKFPESAKTEPLVDTMVAIDEHFDALKAAQKSGWNKTPAFPAPTPTQTATLVWEQFRELSRDPAAEKLGAGFRTKLAEAEQAADALRKLLRDSMDAAEIDAALQRTAQSCTDCHKAHRN